jgi:hypothetical protein
LLCILSTIICHLLHHYRIGIKTSSNQQKNRAANYYNHEDCQEAAAESSAFTPRLTNRV